MKNGWHFESDLYESTDFGNVLEYGLFEDLIENMDWSWEVSAVQKKIEFRNKPNPTQICGLKFNKMPNFTASNDSHLSICAEK